MGPGTTHGWPRTTLTTVKITVVVDVNKANVFSIPVVREAQPLPRAASSLKNRSARHRAALSPS
jgi:hypothetical protein